MSKVFFVDVADALRGFLPKDLREFQARTSARNVKVWYGEHGREHYEVQIVSAKAAKRRRPVLEIGFHAEYRTAEQNEAAIDRARTAQRVLGKRAEAAAFLGNIAPWMRFSELWDGDHLLEPETAIEAAERLSAYIKAIEPKRRTEGA